jgi:hypothetical protein
MFKEDEWQKWCEQNMRGRIGYLFPTHGPFWECWSAAWDLGVLKGKEVEDDEA